MSLYDFEYDPEDNDKEVIEEGLIEQKVDPGYEMEKPDRISWMYYKMIIGEVEPHKMYSFQRIQELAQARGYGFPRSSRYMRILWRSGLVKRYIRGKWEQHGDFGKTGRWYGVHYKFEEFKHEL